MFAGLDPAAQHTTETSIEGLVQCCEGEIDEKSARDVHGALRL